MEIRNLKLKPPREEDIRYIGYNPDMGWFLLQKEENIYTIGKGNLETIEAVDFEMRSLKLKFTFRNLVMVALALEVENL